MPELLVELLTEEIPARMQRRAIEDLTGLIRDRLAAADIPAASLVGHVTPRRLVVIADGIPARQPDRSEERRGPRVGAPEAAIGGFLRATGLKSLADCEIRNIKNADFYVAIINQPGRETRAVLSELILGAMMALPWPKSMRYPASTLRWVRPLNSVVCLFDGEVVGLALGGVPVGRVTRGHRFLAPGEIAVEDAADYLAKLKAAHVVIDAGERRAMIEAALDRLAAAEGLQVKPDPGLLDEVTGLVEYPVPLMGSIDAGFVRPLPDGLPPEVMATAMRTHQKYFTCLNPDGTPAPRFLFVANNVTPDGGKTIAAGNERVLRARLSDAKFFWDQDRKVRLEDRVEALRQRVYHEKLGSVYDKVERVEKLAGFLAEQLAADSRFRGNDEEDGVAKRVLRAARLAKADLSSGMVGEFPELQGIMGRYYALNDGEAPEVADAVAEHYKPLGPNDACPTAPESIVVALADKIDALAAFFAIGEVPTGSRDPFALRRAALGIIRLIIENRLSLSLGQAFSRAVVNVAAQRGPGLPEQGSVKDLLLAFVGDRLKVHLREQGVRHDLITSVFALAEDDLVRLLARVEALRKFLDSDDGANLLTAYRRGSNIVSIEERRDDRKYDDRDDLALMTLAEERTLARALSDIGGEAGELAGREKFKEAMSALAHLRGPVDAFFDKVTVNVSDAALRENRLRLLARIRATMNQVADFSQIEG
jgi:glycyl-tRNA synthetase beta chain